MKSKSTLNIGRRNEIGRIVNAIRSIKGVSQRFSRQLMKNHYITAQQLGALRIIAANPRITLSVLGEQMYLHISTCSGIVDRLEQKKYLVRRRSRSDRRVVYLQITGAGRRIIRKMPISGFGYLMQEIDRLPDSEIRLLSHAITKLLEIMKIEDNQWKEI